MTKVVKCGVDFRGLEVVWIFRVFIWIDFLKRLKANEGFGGIGKIK